MEPSESVDGFPATRTGPEWPKSGVIDFYELFNNKQETVKHTIHVGDPYWNAGATDTHHEPLCGP